MNKVILIGNLTRDPETTETNGGVCVCRFTVAVARAYVGNDGVEADFFNITTFRKTAELCDKYLKKGRKICIVGKIQNRTYEDKKTGEKRYTTDIIADEVEFLSSANGDNSDVKKSDGITSKPKLEPIADDDMPF